MDEEGTVMKEKSNDSSDIRMFLPGPISVHGSKKMLVHAPGHNRVRISAYGWQRSRKSCPMRRLFGTWIYLDKKGLGSFHLEGPFIRKVLHSADMNAHYLVLEGEDESGKKTYLRTEVVAEPSLEDLSKQLGSTDPWEFSISPIRKELYGVSISHQKRGLDGKYCLSLYDEVERVVRSQQSIRFQGGKGKVDFGRMIEAHHRVILHESLYSQPLAIFETYRSDLKTKSLSRQGLCVGISNSLVLPDVRDGAKVLWSFGGAGSMDGLLKEGHPLNMSADPKRRPITFLTPSRVIRYREAECRGGKVQIPLSELEGGHQSSICLLALDGGRRKLFHLPVSIRNPEFPILSRGKGIPSKVIASDVSDVSTWFETERTENLSNGLLRLTGQVNDENIPAQVKELDSQFRFPQKAVQRERAFIKTEKFFAWKVLHGEEKVVGEKMDLDSFGVKMAMRTFNYQLWCGIQTPQKWAALSYIKSRVHLLDAAERDQFETLYSYGKERLEEFMGYRFFSLFGPAAQGSSMDVTPQARTILARNEGLMGEFAPTYRHWLEEIGVKKGNTELPANLHDQVWWKDRFLTQLSLLDDESKSVFLEKAFRKGPSCALAKEERAFLYALVSGKEMKTHGFMTEVSRVITPKRQVGLMAWLQELLRREQPKPIVRKTLRPNRFLSPGIMMPLQEVDSCVQWIEMVRPMMTKRKLSIDYLEYSPEDLQFRELHPNRNSSISRHREHRERALKKDVRVWAEKPEKMEIGNVMVVRARNKGSKTINALKLEVPPHLRLESSSASSINQVGSSSIVTLEHHDQDLTFRAVSHGQTEFRATAIDFNDFDIQVEQNLGVVACH